jgi:primosomal protein N'
MRWGKARGTGGMVLAILLAWMGCFTQAGAGDAVFKAAPGGLPVSETVRQLALWAVAESDAQGRPFAIVDKQRARLHVFDARGALVGEAVALLGSTVGDHTVEGVGLRAQTGQVGIDERTTPAGRFDAVPGRNLSGEHVVWADYASAFAIHRLRPGRAHAARQARMDTATPEDNRVSYGCVIVSVEFYEEVVQRVLGAGRSVVYVLPESGELQQLLRDSRRQGNVRQAVQKGSDALSASAL